MSKILGKKIKELREKAEMHQRALGILLGVGLKQVQRYESGEVEPDLSQLRILMKEFRYDFFSLIRDEGEKPVNKSDDISLIVTTLNSINVFAKSLDSLAKTQNLILEQNQVQIVAGIKKIQTDVNQSMLDNQGRASAISDEIQDWSLQILKALKAPIPSVPVKPSGKNAGKHNRKNVKPDNHSGVNR